MSKVYPLTEQQKGLWFEYELDPKNFRYNTYVHYEILGPLNEKNFLNTLQRMVEVFEIFRTRFIVKDNVVYQAISTQVLPGIIEYQDVGALKLSKRQIEQLLKKRSLLPYNFNSDNPARISLIKANAARYYFSIDIHHIVADAFSASLFCNFISECYNNSTSEGYYNDSTLKGIENYLNLLATSDQYGDQAKTRRALHPFGKHGLSHRLGQSQR